MTTWRWTWLALVSALVLLAGGLGYLGITPDSVTAHILLVLFLLLMLGVVNLAIYEMRVLDDEISETRFHDRYE